MAKAYDWELIQNDYAAGIKTLRQIASEHGCTEGYVRKKAKAENWDRDLSARIKVRSESIVRNSTQKAAVQATEREIIEAVATIHATILIKHRTRISKYQELCEALYAEVSGQTIAKEEFEKLGELMFEPDQNGIDRLNELYKKVIATPSRVDSTKKLSETLKNLIGLERQAWNMSDNANGDSDTKSSIFSEAELIERADLISKRLSIINHNG